MIDLLSPGVQIVSPGGGRARIVPSRMCWLGVSAEKGGWGSFSEAAHMLFIIQKWVAQLFMREIPKTCTFFIVLSKMLATRLSQRIIVKYVLHLSVKWCCISVPASILLSAVPSGHGEAEREGPGRLPGRHPGSAALLLQQPHHP